MSMLEQAIDDQSHNPILDQIESKIESMVKPEDKNAFLRIVTAGMKVMFDQKTHKMAMESVQQGDPLQGAAKGVSDLMVLLAQESRGTMPFLPSLQAAVVLLCQALGFMEQIKMVQLDNDNISEAVKSLYEHMMQRAGLTPEKVDGMIGDTQNAVMKQGG